MANNSKNIASLVIKIKMNMKQTLKVNLQICENEVTSEGQK
jgi:hypothetical protein